MTPSNSKGMVCMRNWILRRSTNGLYRAPPPPMPSTPPTRGIMTETTGDITISSTSLRHCIPQIGQTEYNSGISFHQQTDHQISFQDRLKFSVPWNSLGTWDYLFIQRLLHTKRLMEVYNGRERERLRRQINEYSEKCVTHVFWLSKAFSFLSL